MKKTAIVTGGGSGIGLATAQRLLADGYDVYTIGLGEPEQRVPGIHYQELDVTSDDAVNGFFAPFERIDAIVNAAGIIDHNREWELDGFSRVIDVNLTAVLRITNAALPGLKAARGAVVNFASMWGIFGSAKTPAYASSKAAISELTRCMAVAWATDGVRVNAVAPGWILTNLSRRAFEDPARSESIMARIPMKAWGAPEDVANVIAFLVSDNARYVTGTTLPVDGGYSIA
ncbi:2-dehydro-3-deoxy-D-gluconate 5-dehydrogenase [Pseudomonas fluorescens]|uniref:2-dehydro-3-deoxy-D-gluconate 5-dehydrogenase n=1 Tax=Pseudomonas fluorescens TaxID=294 RepID=A0A5E7SJR1_PSEFL|nr:SDR family oxidoreductase [Pseudomonas fluorescens]VVP86118.1 2-dehydro-3-deoxy-D-gluconate 5-dehydrogenase [Pseudomonas fluorescens]